MKKLKLNSTLNHKCDHYSPYEVIVEKVVTLYGKSFEKLKNNPSAKNPHIAEYCDLMCIDSNDVAHCLLFVDYESGDGILVESEGSDYARKSQFIPNARAVIENNEMTDSERKIRNKISAIAEKLAEMAHCGNKYFSFEDILSEETLDEIKSTILQAVCEKLQQREDIRSVQINDLDIPFQSGIDVEAKSTQGLTFYCEAAMFYDEKRINMLRQRYPSGTRICLDSMENDPQPIPPGTMGTVAAIDDMGQLVMKWDNGRSLSLIPGEDRFHIVQQKMKPDCPLIGEDGNIFHLMRITSRTLKENGMAEEAKEMYSKITQSGSYDEALSILGEYVNITSIDKGMDEYADYEQESETGMNMTM